MQKIINFPIPCVNMLTLMLRSTLTYNIFNMLRLSVSAAYSWIHSFIGEKPPECDYRTVVNWYTEESHVNMYL